MTKLSTALLALVMLMGSLSLSGSNIFYKADSFHQALSNAQTNGKLLLTYAASLSTPSCKAMDNATFQHPEIIETLADYFYPIKINLSNSIGQSWSTEFQIVNSPTLLFFDKQGTLIKQVENAVSSVELQSILQEVLFFNTNGYWPMEVSQPVVLASYVPDHPINEKTPTITERSLEKVNSKPSHTSENKESPQILITQLSTKDPSVATMIESVKNEYPAHPLKIKLVRKKEESDYQIWMDGFKGCPDAERILNALKRQGFEKAKIIIIPKETP